jgi:hypothetical protein
VQFALEGIPLINECDQLSCDTRTIVIWSITGILVTIVAMCLCWNCFIHWRADHATDVPHYLRNIRKQQAKYKEMNIKIAPAKPEYMLDMKAKEAADKAKTERTFLEVKAQKELRKEITQLESRIQRKRVRLPAVASAFSVTGFPSWKDLEAAELERLDILTLSMPGGIWWPC